MSRETRLPEAVQVARLALMKDYPYLSAGLMALIPVESEQCPTMAVDQFWRLYFNPTVVETWSHEEIMAVLWHELTHLTHEHHDRARIMGAYNLPWNVAADAEINDDLREIGMKLPDGVVYPEQLTYKGTKKQMPEKLMAEEYYDNLDIQEIKCSCPDHNDPNSSQSGAGQSSDGQTGNESGEDGDSQTSANSGDQSGDSEGTGEQGGGSKCAHTTKQQSDPNCPIHGKNPIPHGSGSGMVPAPWEPQTGDGDDGQGTRKVGQAEGEIIRRTVAEDTKEVAEKSRGTVPGFMERWASQKLKPQVPWRQVLRGAIRKMLADTTGATDYTRRKPSRRQSAFGKVIMPSLRMPVPNVAMAIDTSGSMGEKELAAGLAEVKGVLRGLGLRDMTVFAVDHAVGFAQKVTNPDKVKLIGGGGTDMGIAIAQAEQMKETPDFLIVFTDGYTPWPPNPPRNFKLIVVSTTDTPGPEYARTVHINMDQGR